MAESTCTIDGCGQAHRARGWCAKHWTRWRTHGDPTVTLYPGKGQCAVADCTARATARDWCATHYTRWQRHGDPLVSEKWRAPHVERFLAYCDRDSTACWLWTRALTAHGYAVFNSDLTTRQAHRWAYLHWNGPLLPGMEIDHSCRVRRCVNPAHLEQVTHAENMRRARGPRKMSVAASTVTA